MSADDRAAVIVAFRDGELAGSLELALYADGFTGVIHDAAMGLDNLSLDTAATLVIDEALLGPAPAAFIASLRSRPWDGLVILVASDGEALRPLLAKSPGVVVLEMPFVASDLTAAIRAERP